MSKVTSGEISPSYSTVANQHLGALHCHYVNVKLLLTNARVLLLQAVKQHLVEKEHSMSRQAPTVSIDPPLG
jgi:hypothetical protein